VSRAFTVSTAVANLSSILQAQQIPSHREMRLMGYSLGCSLVVVVAFIWVAASFVVSSLEKQNVGSFLLASKLGGVV
jgi:hypothetical protein